MDTIIAIVGMLNDGNEALWPLFRLIAAILGLTYYEDDGSLGY
jgi:hypothetical protein